MPRREEIRRYRMSDARLVQLTDSVRQSAQRDATELIAYGVTAATITALEAARDAFADNPTDEELSGDLVIATQAKNAEKTELQRQVRQISDRARIKFGEADGRFRKFGVELLTRQGDDELVRTAKRVVRVATGLLPELMSEGLTAIMIAELGATADNFDNLVDAQDEAFKNRDIAVDERISLGNALYDLLVNLAAKGKLCWEDVNEAKYNDYILSSSSSPATQVTEGNVAAQAVVSTSVTGVSTATVLTLRNTGNVPLSFYFAVLPTDPTGLSPITVAPNESVTRSAIELGYSEQASRFNVNNEQEAPGSYRIEWE